jgi:hypothetical protein
MLLRYWDVFSGKCVWGSGYGLSQPIVCACVTRAWRRIRYRELDLLRLFICLHLLANSGCTGLVLGGLQLWSSSVVVLVL